MGAATRTHTPTTSFVPFVPFVPLVPFVSVFPVFPVSRMGQGQARSDHDRGDDGAVEQTAVAPVHGVAAAGRHTTWTDESYGLQVVRRGTIARATDATAR